MKETELTGVNLQLMLSQRVALISVLKRVSSINATCVYLHVYINVCTTVPCVYNTEILEEGEEVSEEETRSNRAPDAVSTRRRRRRRKRNGHSRQLKSLSTSVSFYIYVHIYIQYCCILYVNKTHSKCTQFRR